VIRFSMVDMLLESQPSDPPCRCGYPKASHGKLELYAASRALLGGVGGSIPLCYHYVPVSMPVRARILEAMERAE